MCRNTPSERSGTRNAEARQQGGNCRDGVRPTPTGFGNMVLMNQAPTDVDSPVVHRGVQRGKILRSQSMKDEG
jgi:hypothetical protein